MSADRYGKCPRCLVRHQAQLEQMDRNINEAYGTVSIEVFDQMRADREKLADTSVGDTLGQYWEVALEPDGLDRELFFRFSASCSECGLKAVIEETHELWKPEDLA